MNLDEYRKLLEGVFETKIEIATEKNKPLWIDLEAEENFFDLASQKKVNRKNFLILEKKAFSKKLDSFIAANKADKLILPRPVGFQEETIYEKTKLVFQKRIAEEILNWERLKEKLKKETINTNELEFIIRLSVYYPLQLETSQIIEGKIILKTTKKEAKKIALFVALDKAVVIKTGEDVLKKLKTEETLELGSYNLIKKIETFKASILTWREYYLIKIKDPKVLTKLEFFAIQLIFEFIEYCNLFVGKSNEAIIEKHILLTNRIISVTETQLTVAVIRESFWFKLEKIIDRFKDLEEELEEWIRTINVKTKGAFNE